MARSAREIIDDFVAGGQAKLVAARRGYLGGGQYVPEGKQAERDAQLLESLLNARDVLELAEFGPEDAGFRAAVERWVATEWGGYTCRQTLVRGKLRRPERRELVREHVA